MQIASLLIVILILNGCASFPQLKPIFDQTVSQTSSETLDASNNVIHPSAHPAEIDEDPSAKIDLLNDYVDQTRLAGSNNVVPEQTSPAQVIDTNVIHHTTQNEQDLLARIRDGFQFDLSIENQPITEQLNWFIRNPSYIERILNRSERYLHYIVSEIEQRGMPAELALLPVVESAFNPFAYSPSRASGLWQFIPSTGDVYGMRRDWWFDGRRDVLASTQGALDFLTWLSKRFDGDWQLAVAAYNSGAGRVQKAIRRNSKKGMPTDFWSLHLPKETRNYVPKLIALSKIIATPETYGFTLRKIADQPYFKVIPIGGQIDLAYAAELAGVDIKEIYQLNAGFNQWATSPDGPHRLLIPIDSANKFSKNLANIPKSQRVTWQTYKIKAGDSLGKISQRYQTTSSVLRKMNRLKSSVIYTGQTIVVPRADKDKSYYAYSQENRIAQKQNITRGKKTRRQYTVQRGDTLWDIARAHKVGVNSLARWNAMAPKDTLRLGQKLTIWSNESPNNSPVNSRPTNPTLADRAPSRVMTQRINYKVRNGDSLWQIASKFNTSVSQLKSWNSKVKNKKYLQPGQTLTLYVDITQG